MNRQELLNQIEYYTPFNEQEETDKQLILNWIRNNTNAFSREKHGSTYDCFCLGGKSG